jgi:DNA-binding CsgD family transcriptional regulator
LLRDQLGSAIAGSGSLVLISGEAGIGKTSLAEDLGRNAATQGALVLVGRCYDLSETPPYGPWRELLQGPALPDDLPPPPAIFVSDGSSVGAASQHDLLIQARAYLAALSARWPLVLLLDDLHWSDLASLDLLRVLAREVHVQPIMIIVIYRDDEVTRRHPLSSLVPTLVREARVARIGLRPLDQSAVWALVEHRYRLPEADRARLAAYLQQHAEGNPFFLTEVLRTLEEEGILHAGDIGWQLGDLSRTRVPPLVRQVIERRLARLGQEAEVLLQAAAVIGQDVRLDVWRAATGVSDEDLAAVLEQASEAHILVESTTRASVRFTHALIREALYQAIVLVRRIGWHRRVAEALIASPDPDADSIAYHLQQAHDPRTADWLVRAGDRARRAYAWATARERYEAALALMDDGQMSREQGWLYWRLANLLVSSDMQRAFTLLDEASRNGVAYADEVLLAQVAFCRGSWHCQMGEYRRGLREMRTGLAMLDGLPDEEHARRQTLLNASAVEFDPIGESGFVMWLAGTGHYAEARAVGERLHARRSTQARSEPASALFAYADLGLALNYASTGQPERARLAYDDARVGYRARDNRIGVYLTLTHELAYLFLPYEVDRPERRRQLVMAIEDAWARASIANIDRSARQGLLPLLALDGSWEEARELAQAGLTRGMGGSAWAIPARVLAWLARAQGEAEVVRRLVRQDLPDGPAAEPGGTIHLTSLSLQLEAAALTIDLGDFATARAWLEAHERWQAWSGTVLGQSERLLLWGRYYQAAGDLPLARSHVDLALAHASSPRQPLALLAAHRLLGELEREDGRIAEAHEHLDAAFAIATACSAPYERALTLLARAELCGANGDRSAAEAFLDEVRAICIPLDARPALSRARAIAETFSILRTAPRHFPDRLTPREVEVLRLIAAGQSNQEIAGTLSISVRTVNRHITNLYTKIGARGKADATAYAFRQRLT